MAERKKIGILFGYSESWIGGTYYFINLIYALQRLEDKFKPHVIIITNDDLSYKKIEETGYPYLSRLSGRFRFSIVERIINKISRILLNKDVIKKGYPYSQLPILFGYYEQLHSIKCKRKLYWIPDLQDKHYPEYLGHKVAESRERQHKALANTTAEIVFSSRDAEKDFEHFYPSSICKTHVIPFAVTLPSLVNVNIENIQSKFSLPKDYFFSPNQFWSHKNHITVIKAVELLKRRGTEVIVVFTGNENTGGGKYAEELRTHVKENQLCNNIRFLGFLDRKEQLALMRESIAVIQPSLFEGWSTVIEDAKALNKFVIASDFAVHHEQLKDGMDFFDPLNFKELAELMSSQINRKKSLHKNYEANIVQYANRFLEVIN